MTMCVFSVFASGKFVIYHYTLRAFFLELNVAGAYVAC